jgi:uncharacterized membrane protein YhiD involved in acid resistance
MRELIFDMVETSKSLSVEQIFTNVGMATVFGFAIFLSYWISHAGTIYSKKFNVSLVTITILTATVMATISNNLALSLGMVGALSIVRYRTAIKDPRDTAYIFWSIVAGICCGSGEYLVCAIGSGAIFVTLLFLGRIKNDNRVLIVIRVAYFKQRAVEGVIFNAFKNLAKLKSKNSTQESVEFIYEVSKKQYTKAQANGRGLLTALYNVGEVEFVNIVTQNDDIF